ncbi:DgyrCDS7694 [Dimorphilus gyrociliatus]|uniref:DgyrCDS7694 n=1 Tax=Dimorphilus gyrociliatus TaxID=2664684 RepID=A0A7I8VU18_9ANNE|nr:DgyrCDS7694 [Dimorphilus gyrociliatus]
MDNTFFNENCRNLLKELKKSYVTAVLFYFDNIPSDRNISILKSVKRPFWAYTQNFIQVSNDTLGRILRFSSYDIVQFQVFNGTRNLAFRADVINSKSLKIFQLTDGYFNEPGYSLGYRDTLIITFPTEFYINFIRGLVRPTGCNWQAKNKSIVMDIDKYNHTKINSTSKRDCQLSCLLLSSCSSIMFDKLKGECYKFNTKAMKLNENGNYVFKQKKCTKKSI